MFLLYDREPRFYPTSMPVLQVDFTSVLPGHDRVSRKPFHSSRARTALFWPFPPRQQPSPSIRPDQVDRSIRKPVVYCAHRNGYDFSIPFTVPLGGVRRSAHAHRQLQRCVQFDNHFSTGGRRVMNLSSRVRYCSVSQLLCPAPAIFTNSFGSLADRKSFSPQLIGMVSSAVP